MYHQAILCNLFFFRTVGMILFGGLIALSKMLLHLFLSLQFVRALKFKIRKDFSLLVVPFMISFLIYHLGM